MIKLVKRKHNNKSLKVVRLFKQTRMNYFYVIIRFVVRKVYGNN